MPSAVNGRYHSQLIAAKMNPDNPKSGDMSSFYSMHYISKTILIFAIYMLPITVSGSYYPILPLQSCILVQQNANS